MVTCEATRASRRKQFKERVCYSKGIWISLGVCLNNSLECLGNEFLFLSAQESTTYQPPIELSLISNESQPAPLAPAPLFCQVSRILLRTRPYKLSCDSLTFMVAHKPHDIIHKVKTSLPCQHPNLINTHPCHHFCRFFPPVLEECTNSTFH